MALTGLPLIICQTLGDGGTAEMAHRIVAWLETNPNLAIHTGIPINHIVSTREIADRLHTTQPRVRNWINDPDLYFPTHITTIANTRIYDWAQVEIWATAHQELTRSTPSTTPSPN